MLNKKELYQVVNESIRMKDTLTYIKELIIFLCDDI